MRRSGLWGGLALILFALGCGQPADTSRPNAQSSGAPVPVGPAGSAPSATASGPSPWLAFGDSITQDAFATLSIWPTAFGGAAPAVVDAAIRGDTSANALSQIDGVLAAHPHCVYVTLAFGTNDAYGTTSAQDFEANMRALAERVQSAGKVPLIPTIPYSPHPRMTRLPDFNQAIADLRTSLGLPAGPDLYAWLQAHPDEISSDQIHMTPAGSQAIQRLWAQVAVGLPGR